MDPSQQGALLLPGVGPREALPAGARGQDPDGRRAVTGLSRPFFRVQFNVVNDKGLPVSIAPPKDFAAVFEVAESDGAVHRPLSLRYGQETLKQIPSDIPNQRYALLLIDISGSMLDSSGDGFGNGAQTSTKRPRRRPENFSAGFNPVRITLRSSL